MTKQVFRIEQSKTRPGYFAVRDKRSDTLTDDGLWWWEALQRRRLRQATIPVVVRRSADGRGDD